MLICLLIGRIGPALRQKILFETCVEVWIGMFTLQHHGDSISGEEKQGSSLQQVHHIKIGKLSSKFALRIVSTHIYLKMMGPKTVRSEGEEPWIMVAVGRGAFGSETNEHPPQTRARDGVDCPLRRLLQSVTLLGELTQAECSINNTAGLATTPRTTSPYHFSPREKMLIRFFVSHESPSPRQKIFFKT
jgi:hypothetical protein